MPQLTPAPRGTRPRNRRELVLSAAAELFVKRGYSKVAMSELAEAVGITSSALYRHFTGKQEILATVLASGLDPVHELTRALNPADPVTAAARLAACALDQRNLALLWQREARNLDPAARRPLEVVVQEIRRRLKSYVHAVRPDLHDAGADLVATSIIAVFSSPSFHHLEIPRPTFEQSLAELAATVLSADLSAIQVTVMLPDPGSSPILTPVSRREELLAQAIGMFAARGYAEVGIEEIAGAVGIAGPSIYNHWSTKLELLTTALRRGAAVLAAEVASAYRQAASPADALRRLLRSYIRLSHSHPELFGLLITDLDNLPEDELHAIRRAQHEHVSEWAHLLQLVQPSLDPVAARIRVHAVLSVANDTARTRRLQRNPSIPGAVETIGAQLLGLPNVS
jgi:AcrR family transcriptional regulator